MKTTRKILTILIWLTWVVLATMWSFTAIVTAHTPHHFKKHHVENLTGNTTGKHLKLFPFNFEKTTTQVDFTGLEKANKNEKKWKEHDEVDEDIKTFHGWALGFLWDYLDDSTLTEDQKVEIQILQTKKQQDMKELHESFINATDEDKESISNKMREVNLNFLRSLESYIPEEKLESYKEFLSELPDRDKKAEKKYHKTKKVVEGKESIIN